MSDHTDDNGKVMFILGEIKGQISGFITGQAAQDARIATCESRIEGLTVRVAVIAAALGASGGYFSKFLH